MDRRLSDLDAATLATLRSRSRTACIVYPNHPLPPGSSPASGRIGVETDAQGRVTLNVDRQRYNYSGADQDVQAWFIRGERVFTSFEAAIAWIGAVIPADTPASGAVMDATSRTADEAGADEPDPDAPQRPEIRAIDELTNLATVVPQSTASEGQIDAFSLHLAINAEVIGQDEAVARIVSLAARHVNKPFPRRPASVMLVGPTGVGKTATAEALAATLTELSGHEWTYYRLDMAEFTERHTTSRLVGAPPGYVGYGDKTLADHLADHPKTVILFDEISRADDQVQEALMNLIDAGRLDSQKHGGVTARQAILLFTTNLGADEIGPGSWSDQAGRQHLQAHGMKPELVGRFGAVVTYTPLADSSLAMIAAKSVAVIAADYGVHLDWIDPEYLSNFLGRLTDQGLGVRHYEHALDAELGEQLAYFRDQHVRIDAVGNVLEAEVAGSAPDLSPGTDTSGTDVVGESEVGES